MRANSYSVLNLKVKNSFLLKTALLYLFFIVGPFPSGVLATPGKDTLAVRVLLESDVPVKRQEPFVIRPFITKMGKINLNNAVAYGCYRKGQAPGVKGPNEAEIYEDLQIILKDWHFIRVYGADEDTKRILTVIKKHKLPIQVLMGVWLSPETTPGKKEENIKQIQRGIQLTEEFSGIVHSVSVGNETQVFWSWHKMPAEMLVRYLRVFRSAVTVPVSTADDYNFWNKPEAPAIAAECDFIFTHIHPLWNGISLPKAMQWTDSVYSALSKTYGSERPIVIGETGWATEYDASKNGDGEQGSLIKGEVSVAAQKIFLQQLDKWMKKKKVTVFLFEAFDESWKGGGETTGSKEVEKHWGVYDENRQYKHKKKTQ